MHYYFSTLVFMIYNWLLRTSKYRINRTYDENNLESLHINFMKLRHIPSSAKTEVCCFYLNNQNGFIYTKCALHHNPYPKYLGVDRSLTYGKHLQNTAEKCNLETILFKTLLELLGAPMALLYSTSEYCSCIWINSAQVSKWNTQLNTIMRLKSGNIQSTKIDWLPVLSHQTWDV